MPNETEVSELPSFNASTCQVTASAWVLRFVFGDAMPDLGSDRAKEIPRMVIGVPWPLAKVLHQVLGAAISSYEAQEGTISVPRTVQEHIDKTLLRPSTAASPKS